MSEVQVVELLFLPSALFDVSMLKNVAPIFSGNFFRANVNAKKPPEDQTVLLSFQQEML